MERSGEWQKNDTPKITSSCIYIYIYWKDTNDQNCFKWNTATHHDVMVNSYQRYQLLSTPYRIHTSIWETPSATPRTKGAVKHASASLWPFWAFTSRQTSCRGSGRWSHVFGWKWVANKANVVWLAESEISCQVAGCVFWKELALKHKGLFLWYASANCCLSHNSPPKAISHGWVRVISWVQDNWTPTTITSTSNGFKKTDPCQLCVVSWWILNVQLFCLERLENDILIQWFKIFKGISACITIFL